MLIRTALRALINNFSQAWTSAYNFSKSMGGDFAKNIDSIKSSLSNVATSIISSLAPAMNYITPIINVMANAIKYLCDLLQDLWEYIGATSELFGVAAETMSNYGSSASSASKEALASFDELNVISSISGSGSGSSGASSSITDEVTDELAKLQVVVGEASIAIGLILAFTGHIPLGVGLIAVGAAAIVKTVVNDWGSLTQDTKDEIATIMAIAGGSFIALGLILAFTGHIGLGVAMLAAGAANLVGVVALSDTLTPELKDKITTISLIASGSLLAIGAILCLTGAAIPLGIGLMIAGAASLATAVALNWDSFTSTIKSTFNSITTFLTNAWDNVSAAVSGAWDNVKKWASERWSNFKSEWENIKTGLKGVWENVSKYVSDAWDKFLKWKDEKWANLKAAWTNIKTNLSNVWINIQNNVIYAWNQFLKWKNERWANIKAAWENIKTGFAGIWTNVQNNVIYAWNEFLRWKNERWANLQVQWENIKKNIVNVWNDIKISVSDAWSKVISWIGLRWDTLKNGWLDIQTRLVNVWCDIRISVRDAWTKVSEWWDTNIVQKVKGAWDSVSTWFYNNVTHPIETFFRDAINGVIDILNSCIDGINSIGHIKWDKIVLIEGVAEIPAVDTYVFKLNKISRLASGGYDVPKGQMFIANEAGAEMVGSMDGKTAVANSQQIVEGIRKGVADGQSEQNALLRQQNDILRRILAKDGSVRLGASSALGRTVRQSLDMYDTMIGG